MDTQHAFVLRFNDISAAEANRYAASLREELLDAAPDLTVEQERQDPATQDFGSTLVLILGAPAVVAVAHGLSRWLTRNNAAKIRLETKGASLNKCLSWKLFSWEDCVVPFTMKAISAEIDFRDFFLADRPARRVLCLIEFSPDF